MNEGSPFGFLSWPWLRCRWRAIQALLLSFMVLDSEKSIKSNLNSIDCKNKTKKSGQMIANKHAKVDCPKNTPVPRAHTLHSQTPWLTPLLWQPNFSQTFHFLRSWLTRCKFHVHSELTTVWNTNFLRWNCPISLLHRLGLCLEGGRIARNKSRKVHRHKSMSTRVLQNIISEWWFSPLSWHQECMGWYA